MSSILKRILAGFSLLACTATHAGIVTYFDKSTFLSDTGATSATGPLVQGGFYVTQALGNVEISVPSTSNGERFRIGAFESVSDWTTRLPGNDLVFGGPFENFNVRLLSGAAYSFGFDFVEPQTDPNVNATFVDSTFRVRLLSGSSLIDSFEFNSPNDVASFVGVFSTAAFDKVEIREIVGGAENEFFGQFYTGTRAPEVTSDIPEPTSLALVGAGLLALTARRRRIAKPLD